MRIPHNTLTILGAGSFDGPAFKLGPERLSRTEYVAVNKVLELAGGKWNTKAKAHLFPDSAEAALEPVMMTGEITDVKRQFQFFETPPELADQMIAAADVRKDDRCLEPSAGGGRIASRMLRISPWVDCVELMTANAEALDASRPAYREVYCGDFLDWAAHALAVVDGPWRYDKIVMNPPFARQADARHFLAATKLLKPTGRIVAIASAAVGFRETPAYQEMRRWVDERGGVVEALPSGTFRESGTMVNTVLITCDARPR